MNTYILDACALIAYFSKENAAEVIKEIFKQVIDDNNTKVYMNKINLLEVYYDTIKRSNKEKADKMLEFIYKMPIEVIHEISDAAFKKAGELKSKYRISLADSVAIAESITRKAILVTSDHHELEIIEQYENVKVKWYR